LIYTRKLLNNKKLSFLGLGCWRFGEKEFPPVSSNPGKNYWNGQKRVDSNKIIDLAVKSGITHYDTAQAYGFGLSEQFTGQKLRKLRENMIIATKIIPSSNNCLEILKKIELSLKRMNTDYIDILYLHWPDKKYDIKFASEALETARLKGLIKYTGVSNFSVGEIKEAGEAGIVDFCQIGYSLLWRHREKDVIPFCVSKGIHIIGYSFYAQGLLFKKQLTQKNNYPGSLRNNLIFLKKENIKITSEIINELDAVSAATGYSIPALLINWAMSKPWLAGILAGASTKNQFDESVKGVNTGVDKTVIDKIDSISLAGESITDTQNIFAHNPYA